jgi:hypothetical protein
VRSAKILYLVTLTTSAVALCFLPAASVQSQVKVPTKRTARTSGAPCAEILKATSTDYMAHERSSQTPEEEIGAIETYGKCYDERTARLASSLARRGKGPKKADLANLSDMEKKLRDFTATALADTNPPGDSLKAAYAALYQEQFRYEFYEAFEEKTAKPKSSSSTAVAKSKKTASSASPSSATKGSAPTAQQSSISLPEKPALRLEGVPASAAPAKTSASSTGTTSPASSSSSQAASTSAPPSATTTNAPAGEDVDPFTKAKNHFGELLGALPPEKIHEVHSSFGKLFAGNPVSEDLKVDIYKYAIYLLEGPKDKPFAPPPF